MPTYEYCCNACGHEFERVQRITDDPVKTCPRCRKRRVQRLISQTSFVLKGSGWYNDLYASKKPDAKKDAPEKGAGDEAGAKSGDGADKKTSKDDSSPKGGKKSKGSKAAA